MQRQRLTQTQIDTAKRWSLGQPVAVLQADGTTKQTITRSQPWRTSDGHWVILVDPAPCWYPLERVMAREEEKLPL